MHNDHKKQIEGCEKTYWNTAEIATFAVFLERFGISVLRRTLASETLFL